MPKVSILMNCLNGEKFLKEAIDSIYAQTFKDWEIIFWDNASTDKSAEIAISYGGGKLKYYKSETTVPLGKARNNALKQASGELIAFLDTDDIWFPQKLEKQVPLFDDPAVGLVFSDAVVYYTGSNKRKPYFEPGNTPEKDRGFSYAFRHYSHMLNMQTIVLRSRVLKEMKVWFNENFQICTDFDLFLRILNKWKYDFVNEPLAEYRVHENATMAKMYNRLPAELEASIKNFKKEIPGFEAGNKENIKFYDKMIANMWGKYYWSAGETLKAREYYGKYMLSSFKIFFSWFLTFLPFNLIRNLWELVKKLLNIR